MISQQQEQQQQQQQQQQQSHSYDRHVPRGQKEDCKKVLALFVENLKIL